MRMLTKDRIHAKLHIGNPKDWCQLCISLGRTPPSKSVTTPKPKKYRRHHVVRQR